MVDDLVVYLEEVGNILKGHVKDFCPVHATDEMDTQALFQEIMSLNPAPTVILLDFSMVMGKKKSAIDLLKMLKAEENKDLICIGFSSENMCNEEFLKNGAHGAVLKNGRNLLLMSEISEIVEKVRKEEQK